MKRSNGLKLGAGLTVKLIIWLNHVCVLKYFLYIKTTVFLAFEVIFPVIPTHISKGN